MSTDTPTGHDSGRTSEMSTTICRIPVLPFVNKVKAGQTGPPEDRYTIKEKSCRSIWLRFTTPTTTTRPQRAKRSNCALNPSSPVSQQIPKPENKPPNYRSTQRRCCNAIHGHNQSNRRLRKGRRTSRSAILARHGQVQRGAHKGR